jgi:PadR family transcriptional regulator PadR
VRSAEHNGRLRKYYRITEAGEARIHAFLGEWRQLMRALDKIEAEVEEHDQT